MGSIRGKALRKEKVDYRSDAQSTGDLPRVMGNTGHPHTLIRLLQQQRITAMDWNRVEGNWKEVKGKVKEKWGKLTDDDLTAINGQRDQLEGRLQQRYGFAKDQARKDVDTWFSSLK
jgi:uncharacterized protein YjbJ (UPF0337 family)